MDALKVGKAVGSGLSIFCATCRHYWQGREQGLPDPKCTAQAPCGSLFVGMAFPEYDGPITDRTRWCFVCGSAAVRAVAVKGQSQFLGMCAEHIPMLRTIEPVSLDGPKESDIDLIGKKTVSVAEAYRPPRKSLVRDIAESEAYFEEQKRRGKKG